MSLKVLVLPPLCCRNYFLKLADQLKTNLSFAGRVSFQTDQSPDPADCLAAPALLAAAEAAVTQGCRGQVSPFGRGSPGAPVGAKTGLVEKQLWHTTPSRLVPRFLEQKLPALVNSSAK